MSKEDEAHRNWQVQPCDNPPGWWSVGYTYEGIHGSHQGEFVPIHHWAGKVEAETMVAALLDGATRDQAKKAAMEV